MKNNEIIINDYEKLIAELNIPASIDDKLYLESFFKRKGFRIKEQKIVNPKIEEVKETIKELQKQIATLKDKQRFWRKQLVDANNYHKIIKVTKFIKKDYWLHKIKEATNNEYKQDIKDCKLTDDVLMDPEYQNLKNSFFNDPDYRKKLGETVSKSIIYKKSNIGDHSKTKQEFRAKSAEFNIKKIDAQIKELSFSITAYEKAMEFIKTYS
jgi:hypothetical protein